MSIEIWDGSHCYIDDSITNETSDIGDLDLSVTDYNYYRKLGFCTIGQLISNDTWFFFNQPVHSFMRFERLIRSLDNYGFRLRDCSKEKYPSVEPLIASFKAEDNRRFVEEMRELTLEVRREQSRIRSRRYRERQKALKETNKLSNTN